MKRETLLSYIKYTTIPYSTILKRIKKTKEMTMDFIDNKTIHVKIANSPSITLYFYDNTLSDLQAFTH